VSALAACYDFEPGVSQDARRRQVFAERPVAAAATSVPLTYGQLEWDVLMAALDASVEGWDGYRGKPVSQGVLKNACSFAQQLQRGWRRPDVVVDATGDIWFQWQQDPRRTFAVAIGAGQMGHYAGLFGTNRVSGAESFNDRLLQVVAANLERVFLEGAPAAA